MAPRIIFATLLSLTLATPAFASEIHGTVSSGPETEQQGTSGSVSGTVGGQSSGSIGGTVSGGSGGTISGTVSGGSSGGGGGGSSGSGGGGGGSISPIASPGTSTGFVPATPVFFGTNIPAPLGTNVVPQSTQTSGGLTDDSDNQVALAGTDTGAPEVFGTNQTAAAANSGLGAWWWAIALAALALIALAWAGYRRYGATAYGSTYYR